MTTDAFVVQQYIDEICDRFETACKEGRRPSIEDVLAETPEAVRPALLPELVALDIAYRRLDNEQPEAKDYQARFPTLDLDWLVREILPPESARIHSSNKSAGHTGRPVQTQVARIRCPHCHELMILVDDRPDDVLCPGCGSFFHVRDARPTVSTTPMKMLGKFELLERVGVGAFGAVWKARDTTLDRIVALKIPHSGLLTSGDEMERFQREAKAAAQLRHPGIVSVHEVVTLDGLPTLVSDFVTGVPLRDFLEVRRLTFRESAQLIAQVADAVHYAHSMGVIHRDVKPGNIMLEAVVGDSSGDQHSESHTGAGSLRNSDASSLAPRIMDFGLAFRPESDVTLTQDGHVLGTPAYMSPEQAAGKGHQADARSDVYSLGVILYELLSGELPFRGSKAMLLLQVLHDEPKSLRRLNDKIPRDLETVCQKAMAKNPAKRYQTARELAEDLRRWLRGEPIVARPISRSERALRWIQRQPARAAAYSLLGLVVVLGVFCAVAVSLWLEGHAARLREEQAKRQLDDLVAQLSYFRHVELAHRMLRANEPHHADKLLAECPRELRHWEWHFLKRLVAEGERQANTRVLKVHDSPVNFVALSPDGLRFATSGDDNLVRLWDTATARKLFEFKHDDLVRGLAFHPTGKLLASCSRDKTARLWDLETGEEQFRLTGHKDGLNNVAFSPDGQFLISTSFDHKPKVWSVATGEEVCELEGHQESTFGLAFSPDGVHVATTSDAGDQSVKIWDFKKRSVVHSLVGHNHRVTSVAFSRDGKLLASAGGVWDDKEVGYKSGQIKVWDAKTGAVLHTIPGHDLAVTSLVFLADGRRLASASQDGSVRLWDTVTGQPVLTLEGHGDAVSCVTLHCDGVRLFSSARDGTVRIWDGTPLSKDR